MLLSSVALALSMAMFQGPQAADVASAYRSHVSETLKVCAESEVFIASMDRKNGFSYFITQIFGAPYHDPISPPTSA